MSLCIFCEIENGRVPASIVFRDADCLAFLDHRPLFPGHCLLVPRAHVETLTDISQDLLAELSTKARLLALAMEKALGAEGSFLALNNRVSQSVPHLHLHIVPRTKGDGLKGFFWPRKKYRDSAHVEEVREKLVAACSKLTVKG
jgi:histidine triad (HIT) family protein